MDFASLCASPGCSSALLQRVHSNTRAFHEDTLLPPSSSSRRPPRGQRATPDQIHNAVRDSNIELITMMLEALEKEHEFV